MKSMKALSGFFTYGLWWSLGGHPFFLAGFGGAGWSCEERGCHDSKGRTQTHDSKVQGYQKGFIRKTDNHSYAGK